MKKDFYKWFQNNLKGYMALNNDENRLLQSLKEHPITEQSYDNFVKCFENNIFSYYLDLENNKQIVSTQLDCYFIDTYAGKVPIGYYKDIRPVETAALSKNYIKKSEAEAEQQIGNTEINWNSKLQGIAEKLRENAGKKYYTLRKSIVTFLISLLAFGMTLIAILRSKIIFDHPNLKILPCLARANTEQINGFLTFMIILLILMTGFIVCNIREIKQLVQNKFMSNFLDSSNREIENIRQNLTKDVDQLYEQLLEAAETGHDLIIRKSNHIKGKIKFKNQLKKMEHCISQKQTYIPMPVAILLTVITLLLPICYTDVVPKLDIELTYQQKNQTMQNKNSSQNSIVKSTIKPAKDKETAPATKAPTPEPAATVAPTVMPSKSPSPVPTDPITNAVIYSVSDIINEDVCPILPTDAVITSPTYLTYHDTEFGFDLDFPAHFEKLKTNDDSDSVQRCVYTSKDYSAVLKINAGYNKGNITPQEISERLKYLYYGDVTYNPVTKNWFAITITNNVDSFYAYYKWSNGMIRGFEFYFNGLENADTYDKYINEIYSSFKNNSYFDKSAEH